MGSWCRIGGCGLNSSTLPKVCYEESKALLERWHDRARLRYAVTPRFSVSCSEALLEVCGALMREHPGVFFQTHLNESKDEIRVVKGLFPWASDYLETYERFGLVGPQSVFAHDVHVTEGELSRLAKVGAGVAHCPSLQRLHRQWVVRHGEASRARRPFRNLEGLQFAVNLTELSLSFNNDLSDLSPLAGLSNLRSLSVGFSPISDLSPLAELTNLVSLSLPRTDISDLSPLEGLTNLESLDLAFNGDLSLGPLASLTTLTNLNLVDSNLSNANLSPLAGLTNLESLGLSENSLSDLGSLAGLTNLKRLSLEDFPDQ